MSERGREEGQRGAGASVKASTRRTEGVLEDLEDGDSAEELAGRQDLFLNGGVDGKRRDHAGERDDDAEPTATNTTWATRSQARRTENQRRHALNAVVEDVQTLQLADETKLSLSSESDSFRDLGLCGKRSRRGKGQRASSRGEEASEAPHASILTIRIDDIASETAWTLVSV